MELTAAPAPPDQDLHGRYSVIVCVETLNGQPLPDTVRPSEMVRQLGVTGESPRDALAQVMAPVEPTRTLHEIEHALRETSARFAGGHVNADVVLTEVRRRLAEARS